MNRLLRPKRGGHKGRRAGADTKVDAMVSGEEAAAITLTPAEERGVGGGTTAPPRGESRVAERRKRVWSRYTNEQQRKNQAAAAD